MSPSSIASEACARAPQEETHLNEKPGHYNQE